MMSNRHYSHIGYWISSILAGLLCLLIPCTGAWAQGKGLRTEDTRQRSTAKGLHVVVQEGRLSIDVQESDLGEVLAHIGRQANIRISSGPSVGKRVSARFTGVELEEGLRRLLRLASLSHIFLYANGPGGTVTISEVRVLGEGQDTTPRSATVAEPHRQENAQNAGTPVGRGRRQAQNVAEPVLESMPDPEQGEPSEVTRRVREVFQLSKGMGRRPSNDQGPSPDEPK